MKAKVIINPSSGRKIFQQGAQLLLKKMAKGGVYNVVDAYYTQKQGDAYFEAQTLDVMGYDLVIAVGGDGTLHEVINGLMDSGSRATLAIMPAGTVNDFGTFMKIPVSVEKYYEMVMRGNTQLIDLGKCNNSYFLNVAAGGMLTSTAYTVPAGAKTLFGKLAYYASGALEMPQQLLKSLPLKTQTTDRQEYTDALMFLVANTSSVGGFRKMLPNASIIDGLLDVIIMRKGNLVDLSGMFLQLTQGKHTDHPLISYYQTDRIDIWLDNDDTIPLDLDGEQVGQLPARIRVCPKAVRLLIP